MIGWKDDKRWSDRFLPEIKRHLGEFLIDEPENFEEDKKHNTDLVVLELRAVRIACRIRRDNYREKYKGEFTIRSNRNSGNETELSKIITGWGDYFFYGFADDNHLTQWFIGDLKAFRKWFSVEQYKRGQRELPGKLLSNTDGSSDFRAFEKDSIPNFIIAENAT